MCPEGSKKSGWACWQWLDEVGLYGLSRANFMLLSPVPHLVTPYRHCEASHGRRVGDTTNANATNQDFLIWKGRLSAQYCLCVSKVILRLGNNGLCDCQPHQDHMEEGKFWKGRHKWKNRQKKHSWNQSHLKLFLCFRSQVVNPNLFDGWKDSFPCHFNYTCPWNFFIIPFRKEEKERRRKRLTLLILDVLSPRSDLEKMQIYNAYFGQQKYYSTHCGSLINIP